jgi:uncharacterized protein (TIGR02246 family)
MAANMTPARDDKEVRERIEALAHALRAKDLDALMTFYAPDVVTFDVRPPLQVQGAAAYRKNFERWFASVLGPLDYEMHDLRITMGDRLALSHNLSHVKGASTAGDKIDYWVRVTASFQKINGRWLITHEHVSIPHSS